MALGGDVISEQDEGPQQEEGGCRLGGAISVALLLVRVPHHRQANDDSLEPVDVGLEGRRAPPLGELTVPPTYTHPHTRTDRRREDEKDHVDSSTPLM